MAKILKVSAGWKSLSVFLTVCFILLFYAVNDLNSMRELHYAPTPQITFNITLGNYRICSKEHNTTLLIFVYMKPQDFSIRNAIRSTWGNKALLQKLNTSVFFLLGLSASDVVSRQVMAESQHHRDIVQGSFMDSYRNLSYKGIMMLHWVTRNCPHTKFLLKVDTDIYVNTTALVPLLQEKYAHEETKSFGCSRVHWLNPVEHPGIWCGKWCVKWQEYRHLFYPTYCEGPFYLVKGKHLLHQMYMASKTVPIWWIDDVYMTGLIPRHVGNVQYFSLGAHYEKNTFSFFYKDIVFRKIKDSQDVNQLWTISQAK